MKMIVTDLDGTLLNGEDHISACDRDALRRAQAAGIQTVIATGRPLKEARWCVDEVNAYPYFVGMNGCQTINLQTGAVYHEALLSYAATLQIVKVLEQFPVFFEAYTKNGIESLTSKKKWISQSGLHEHFISNAIQHITFVEQLSLFNEPPQRFGQSSIDLVYKFFIPTDSAHMSALLVASLSGIEEVSVTTSLGNFVEVIPAGCNKAAGIAAICKEEGISPQEIMAVGDSQNDMEMLAFCGISAAVGNAKPEVKAAVDMVLPDHNHGGVAGAVDYILDNLLR